MLSYETLDAIADAYNPLLATISLLLVVLHMFRAQWKPAGLGLAGFSAVAVVAYGFMFLDNFWRVWPAFGLDYSTHTATALGLVMLLALQTGRLRVLWFGSLLCYVLLMVYQRYHTFADIATTALVVVIPLGLGLFYLFPQKRAEG